MTFIYSDCRRDGVIKHVQDASSSSNNTISDFCKGHCCVGK